MSQSLMQGMRVRAIGVAVAPTWSALFLCVSLTALLSGCSAFAPPDPNEPLQSRLDRFVRTASWPPHSAVAVARGARNSTWVGVSSHLTEQAARDAAIYRCRTEAVHLKIEAPCYVYAVDGAVVGERLDRQARMKQGADGPDSGQGYSRGVIQGDGRR